jgi:hypothetical protein
MDIIRALHDEEARLQQQLKSIQGAIAALNGSADKNAKRTMSAAVRARISRKAKARWAKIRVQKTKKTK